MKKTKVKTIDKGSFLKLDLKPIKPLREELNLSLYERSPHRWEAQKFVIHSES